VGNEMRSLEDIIEFRRRNSYCQVGRMDFQVARWAMEIDQVEVSYTARGAVMKVKISRWEMIWDQLIS
jgi:hypothetical protein